MRRVSLVLMATALAAVASAQFAADNASNAGYVVGQEYIQVGTPPGDQTAAQSGLNGGFGFTKWLRGGYFGVGSAYGTSLITGVDPSFHMGIQQFGLQANKTFGFEGTDARRSLNRPSLPDLVVGESLRFSMMPGGAGAGTANTSGDMGVEIRSALLGNPGRDIFAINGSPGQNYRIIHDTNFNVIDTGVPVAEGVRVDVMIKVLGGDQYEVTISPCGGYPATFTAKSIYAGTAIRTFQFYAFDCDGDFYVNNLAASEPQATIKGMVELNGLSGPPTSPIMAVVEIRFPGSFVPIETKEVCLAPDGSYWFTTGLTGSYDITAKATHWLRAKRTTTIIGTATVTGVDFSLLNGDVDEDNVVSVFDYIALSDAFDSVPGDTNWLPNADLDHDGVVSVFDYIQLSDNFDLEGAP